MKNKHPNAIVVLALGFAMAGLHLADLLLWSDAETGFATAGSVWLRYIPWLAALVLPYLPARRAANQPTGLQDTCPAAGAVYGAGRGGAGHKRRGHGGRWQNTRCSTRNVLHRLPDLGSLGRFIAAGFVRRMAAVLRRPGVQGFWMQRQKLGSPLFAGTVPLYFCGN